MAHDEHAKPGEDGEETKQEKRADEDDRRQPERHHRLDAHAPSRWISTSVLFPSAGQPKRGTARQRLDGAVIEPVPSGKNSPVGRDDTQRPRKPQTTSPSKGVAARRAEKRRREKRRRRIVRYGVLTILLIGSAILANIIIQYAFANIPLPKNVELASSSEVYDADGKLIATYSDEITRFLIDTHKLPDHVRQAVVAAEDRDFFEHEGVSVRGLARAAWQNVSAGGIKQGGSTITQQYVKNAVLRDSSRTVERKLKELILAIKLERRYTKGEILDMYLNTVYFGRGAYGIEAASRAYFNKHASKLSVGQAAYLAGIIPSPQRYQVDTDREAAQARRDYVVRTMLKERFINARQAKRASKRKIKVTDINIHNPKEQKAAYFLEWVRKAYLYPKYGDCLYTCGLKIYTTLDLDMQDAAEDAIRAHLNDKADPQAALVSMTPAGEVKAYVGGRAYTSVKSARGFNYASDGERQTGSALKPFTLLAAIEQDISTESRFGGSSPETIEEPECTGPDGIWEPENYGGASYGTLTLEEATANSVNTVFAQLIAEIGPDKVADVLERLGFRDATKNGRIRPHCSLALGTLGASPLQMARAYAGFAGRGRLPHVMPLRYVLDSEGKCLQKFRPAKGQKCGKRSELKHKQAVDENSVDVLTRTLTGVVTGGTATAADIGRPVAGKTGTTQDHRDAWFAGYTPQLATVVWMGYPIERGPDKKTGSADDFVPLMHYCNDPRRCRPVDGIEVTGGSFPADIWAAFMSRVLESFDIAYFTPPVDEPDEILNEAPPPPPPPQESKPDKKRESDGDGGGGGGGGDKPGGGNGGGD
ncbi:MAG: PBP1A family penicillin-binding protein [Actinobacteria bacterium]|nr:PBP1A family penicillin-binding protein [Actinomycetota bacterium]